MDEFAQQLVRLSLLVFVICSMLAIGLGQRLQEVVAPLRNPKRVVLALLLNFLIAPMVALVFSRAIPLRPPHAIGLLILGGAAGSPLLPKLAQICGGRLSDAVALMVLLMFGSILFMPLALPFFVPGLRADALVIAKPLVLLLLVPLAGGFVLARTGATWVSRLHSILAKLSNVAFIALVVVMIGSHLDELASTLGSFAIGTYVLYVLTMVAIGLALGGLHPPTRDVFGLSAGQRNVPAALVTAKASFDDPAVTVMLLVGSVVGLLVLLPLARWVGRRSRRLARGPHA